MTRIKKGLRHLRFAASLALAVLMAVLLPLTAFAADRGLSRDRNGTGYTYVIGYCYSGYQGGINTREVFTAPDNYAIWRCPVCGQGGGSSGTALYENQYLPCYAYDIGASGGDTWIRYAKVRHRHNNGSLSSDIVYIPINVAQYSGCYYRYDTTAPSGGTASAPTGWQSGNVTVTFGGGSDSGDALPDWTATPGNYGSGIHHHEYRIDSGGWTGCPVGQNSVTISKGGATTVTARVVDGAGNAASQTSTATVYIDNVAPAAPTVAPSTAAWTNQNVTVTLRDNGDTYSGVNRTEYSTDGGAYAQYASPLTLSAHGRHTVVGRVVDNVGHVSGTASTTVLIDKVAPTITGATQTPNAGRTELTLGITASDADSGVAGYAVTAASTAPPASAFSASMPKVTKNGLWYVWARDNAGNISAATQVRVVALDSVPPVVSASTQRTWDATTNWAKLDATDDNSGVAQIGWSLRNDASGITWANATASHTFNFTSNGSYYAYAKDVAGNVSAPVRFVIDRIDKHSPDITNVTWEPAWTREKTVTVTAVDTESGMGQYAITRTTARPTAWQDSNRFPGITQNGVYYLWAKDNVQRVSADKDADDTSPGTPPPGPVEITITTVDRSRPVMDAINHSARDNAPQGVFLYPYFNTVDRPELLAHDVGDSGGQGAGIKHIQYQYVPEGAEAGGEWLVYDDAERPAMREEFLGKILARAEDVAGNVSEPMDATFLFETTPPGAVRVLTPGDWTNGPVLVAVSATDATSGVRDITLPDGTVVDGDAADFVVEQNGAYTLKIRDFCGNVLFYDVDVSNIDLIPPIAESTITPDEWTNGPVTIEIVATDSDPEDGYDPSGIASITLPDGTVVESDTADFVVDKNGVYSFEVVDKGGNNITHTVEVSNIDLLPPTAESAIAPDEWTNQPVTITVEANDPDPKDGYRPSGIASITLPGGIVVDGDKAEFVVEKNGVYAFTVTDNGGNSITHTVEVSNIDLIPPTADSTITPDEWTNQPITIEVVATDPDPEDGYDPSGIVSITLPDGTVVDGDKAEFVVSENGEYTFIVTDNGGNTYEYTIMVDNYDEQPPVVDFHFDGAGGVKHPEYGQTEYYNYDLALMAEGEDDASGIDRYEYRVGTDAWTVFDLAKPPVFSDEQISTIYVRVWDVAGNVSKVKSRDIVLDKTAPIASHTLTPSTPTSGAVSIRASANYDISGPQSLVLPDGQAVYSSNSAEYTVSRNGEYAFTFWDMCGNQTAYTVAVSNITMPLAAASEPPAKPIPPRPAQSPPAEPEPPAPFEAQTAQAEKPLPRLTLLDLLLTLIAVLCALLVCLRRRSVVEYGEDRRERRRKRAVSIIPNVATALTAIVLFFTTQPLVWRFRLIDWWTVLFAILAAISLWLYLRKRNEESETRYKKEEF